MTDFKFPIPDPLDDIELWTRHVGYTNSGAKAEKALRRYREWKERSLEYLWNLSNCGLTTLPLEIGALTFITHLYCNHNELTTLPPEIGTLTSLILLHCSNNQLTTLPLEIGKLTSLKGLFCYKNNLTTLPIEIGKLTSLTHLICDINPFAEGEPTTIEELQERWRTRLIPVKAAKA